MGVKFDSENINDDWRTRFGQRVRILRTMETLAVEAETGKVLCGRCGDIIGIGRARLTVRVHVPTHTQVFEIPINSIMKESIANE